MKSLWSDADAGLAGDDLGLRVYTSRLLGAEPSLVMHGGGNTSVKLKRTSLLGEEQEILFVKGSGWDLATIAEKGFSPVRLEPLRKMAGLKTLTDRQMVAELLANMTDPSAPTPSVEAILHAILPHRFVDHTHADSVVTITNSVGGADRIREIYGEDAVVIPYVMPGFDLAKLCADLFPKAASPKTKGMILLNHGVFSFGETARESYERMIELVTRAENYLKEKKAWDVYSRPAPTNKNVSPEDIARLRSEVSRVAGFPLVMQRHSDAASMAFAQRAAKTDVAVQGPATPDHVIRTKRTPMIGRDAEAYAEGYRSYFAKEEPRAAERKKCLDPAPRVILDPDMGMLTLGRSASDASVVADIYTHTIDIISRAELLGGYRALPPSDLFDVEYWDLEQAKLARAPKPGVFAGEVVMVTGAASGIGRACVDSFLARGAAVVGLDLNASIESLQKSAAFRGIKCDVTDEAQVAAVFAQAIDSYGGVDMLVLNAGIFPASRKIADLESSEWRKVMQVNLDSNLTMLRKAHPFLRLAPKNGRVAIVGSKNVAAPGLGAAAYSASKAALNQLARVAALEWAVDGIRINSVHPHGVFDTGIWTDEVIKSRAEGYGMTVEEYRKNNLLGTTIESADVAELVAELCGPVFSKSTGVHVPIDGGSDRII
jgi:rhamnose utilization protein RhaD (predicted bifunctional aldolase and dehydrogenase)/NAD(P)-dependent dehydrogenase (short-subunit alcohol dehydrogenase family)